MTTPHRDIVNDLMDALIEGVPALAGATQHRTEPVWHDPNGTHLAVWFDDVSPDERFNTTGSMALADIYAIRYWEPAPYLQRMVVDEDAVALIEAIMDATVDVLMANQGGIGTSYATRFAGAKPFNGQDRTDTPWIAGFEAAVSARRDRVYT